MINEDVKMDVYHMLLIFFLLKGNMMKEEGYHFHFGSLVICLVHYCCGSTTQAPFPARNGDPLLCKGSLDSQFEIQEMLKSQKIEKKN